MSYRAISYGLRSSSGTIHASSVVSCVLVCTAIIRPSGDQSSTNRCPRRPAVGTSTSGFEPSAGRRKMLESPARSESNASSVPSLDQTGCQSFAGCDVKRVVAPVVRSICQMSRLPVSRSFIVTAARFPSGASRSLLKRPLSNGVADSLSATIEPHEIGRFGGRDPKRHHTPIVGY